MTFLYQKVKSNLDISFNRICIYFFYFFYYYFYLFNSFNSSWIQKVNTESEIKNLNNPIK